MLAHDWCHARRRFIDAEPTSPTEAAAFLDDIGKLFLIERELVDQPLEVVRERRQRDSRPLVNAIGQRAVEIHAVPETPIADAIRYLDNQ